jgi:chromosomal replication initiator protein
VEPTLEIKNFWEDVCSRVGVQFGSHIANAYLKPVSLEFRHGKAILYVPSRLVRTYIEEKLLVVIMEAIKSATGLDSLEVEFQIAKESTNIESDYQIIKKLPPQNTTPKKNNLLNPKYTFDTYVVGAANQFCHAAAFRVAESPGAAYNPLFIYGGVGLGKTHLLHAIGNACLERNPDLNVLYLSSEGFTNELIDALRFGKMDQFKAKMRSVEVLLIDDIQFMAGKERTQEEFFHTFNTLYGLKHQIVITSDKLPSAIPGMEERLQTRFFWGLTADLQAPDFETRVAILNKKASSEGYTLPPEVSVFIAKNISSNVRELEGALTRLAAISSMRGEGITMSLAEGALLPLLSRNSDNISIELIKKTVASHFSLKPSDLASKRRTKNLSFPRHIAMYLCRKHTTFSYPEIATHFGGRDHSSVVHAANVVAAKVKVQEDLRSTIAEIEKKLGV